MGVIEVLTIVFAVAKIMGKLDWTWYQVFYLQIAAGIFYLLLLIGVILWSCKKN